MIMFLGPGCSKAAIPVAESIHYWNIVQVSLTLLWKCDWPSKKALVALSLIKLKITRTD